MRENLPWSEQFRLAGEEWADLDAAARLLEETKTAVMAQKQAAMGDIPVNRAEQMVKASREWHDHLVKIVDAKTAANKAKIHLDWVKMKYHEEQSQNANRRVEISMLGGGP